MNTARSQTYGSTLRFQQQREMSQCVPTTTVSGTSNPLLGVSSSTTVQLGSVKPKYKSIQEAEQVVDRHQATSLRRLIHAHRQAHPILTNHQDYFYRKLLLPAAMIAIVKQIIRTLVLISLWTLISDIFSTIFSHVYLNPNQPFLTDLYQCLNLEKHARNPRNIFGTIALSVASTWYFLENMWIPPPVFNHRYQKLSVFFSGLALNSSWTLICAGLMFMKPDFVPHEITPAVASNMVNESALFAEETVESGWYSSHLIFWEVVLKVLMPFLFSLLLIVTTNCVLFWKGEFYIGNLRVNQRFPDLIFAQNVRGIIRKIRIAISDAIHSLLTSFSVPGYMFGVILLIFLVIPVVFPVADLLRIWIHYHCISFAIVHAWKKNIYTIKKSVSTLQDFGNLTFLDVLDMPPICVELQKIRWRWTAYLELQLQSDITEKLKRDPSYLREFLGMHHQSKDIVKLDNMIQIWLTPIRDYVKKIGKYNTSLLPLVEPMSRMVVLSFWALDKLFSVYRVYDETLVPVDQDFHGSEYSEIIAPSFRIAGHLNLLTQFVIRCKAVDTQRILFCRYDSILEQVAALVFSLGELEKSGLKSMAADTTLLYPTSNLEPGLRFHLKWHRQLVHLSQIYLGDMLKVIGKDVSELHFKEYPAMQAFLENFTKQEKESDSENDIRL